MSTYQFIYRGGNSKGIKDQAFMSPLQRLNTFPLKVLDVRDPSGFEKQTMEMEIGNLGSKALRCQLH